MTPPSYDISEMSDREIITAAIEVIRVVPNEDLGKGILFAQNGKPHCSLGHIFTAFGCGPLLQLKVSSPKTMGISCKKNYIGTRRTCLALGDKLTIVNDSSLPEHRKKRVLYYLKRRRDLKELAWTTAER